VTVIVSFLGKFAVSAVASELLRAGRLEEGNTMTIFTFATQGAGTF
jgi:hypothetical protein